MESKSSLLKPLFAGFWYYRHLRNRSTSEMGAETVGWAGLSVTRDSNRVHAGMASPTSRLSEWCTS